MMNPEGGRWKAEGDRQIGATCRMVPPHISPLTPHGFNGFTLLEVMMAVSIMALVLVTLLGLKNRTTQNVALADHITTATMLAKRLMVDTMIKNPLKKWMPDEEVGDFADEEYFKDYTWKKTISLIPLFNNAVITEIRIAVLWKEGARQEMVELVDCE
jgi:prepilin-type N-terminal cleavage/methylation domain-containing protein